MEQVTIFEPLVCMTSQKYVYRTFYRRKGCRIHFYEFRSKRQSSCDLIQASLNAASNLFPDSCIKVVIPSTNVLKYLVSNITDFFVTPRNKILISKLYVGSTKQISVHSF